MENLIGKQLGPYQIVSQLGIGGMATVFKAYQPIMDRYVALKILSPRFSKDPEFVRRFSREAHLIAKLEYPHILPVYDFGEADGYTYLAMRLVKGGSLLGLLQKHGKLELTKINHIISQTGGALDYAHKKGVIHRDLKPGNILIDEHENCLLTDFGIAKLVEATTQFTHPGGLLGTPLYISPELGSGKQIDGRSDIYSLGVVLYHMVVGHVPYKADTPMGVVYKHIHDPVPLPRQQALDLSEPVERVILKALAKNPDDRYSTAAALVNALQSALDQPTSQIVRETLTDLEELPAVPSAKPRPKNFNYKKQHAATDTKSEPAPTHILTRHQEAKIREDVIDFVEKKTDTPKWTWWPIATSLVLILTLILWVYPGLIKEDTLQYERTALAHYNQGNFQKALDVCKILDDKRPEISLTYLIRGNIYLANGKLDAAEAEYHKGLQVQKQTEVQKAQVLAGLGRIASLRKQLEAALRYYQQATEAAPKNSLGYVSQALVLEERRDYENALDLLEKARALEPQNRVLAAITHETRQRAAINRDQKKQERLDRLVKELLETMEEGTSVSSIDDWTSLPLTLWIMNFEAQGYSIQEGQERLLVSGISAQMLQHSRARLVERSLLNKLVEELRLGTSKLIDRSTALSLGRILAARLIISGHMVYAGPLVQISIRFIETETGQIIASISESFGSTDTASVIVDRLSKKLLQELMELYPLRGKISEVKDTEFELNIGEMVGAQMGQRFRVIDEDEILEIISTRKDSSLAKVVRGKGLLQAGRRVEIIQYPLN